MEGSVCSMRVACGQPHSTMDDETFWTKLSKQHKSSNQVQAEHLRLKQCLRKVPRPRKVWGEVSPSLHPQQGLMQGHCDWHIQHLCCRVAAPGGTHVAVPADRNSSLVEQRGCKSSLLLVT